MRLLLIAAAAFAPAASAAAPAPRGAPAEPVLHSVAAEDAVISPFGGCPAETARMARALKAKPELHTLTDLPDANAYSAVFRRTDGCPDPVVISYDVGKARR
jgi:hypothetical protein